MMASNSAASSSSSAHTSAMNSSSRSASRSWPSRASGVVTAAPLSARDGLPLVLVRDGDLSGLGPLRDRDRQGEHAGVVAGLDPVGVETVAQDELPAEHSPGSLGGDEVGVARSG